MFSNYTLFGCIIPIIFSFFILVFSKIVIEINIGKIAGLLNKKKYYFELFTMATSEENGVVWKRSNGHLHGDEVLFLNTLSKFPFLFLLVSKRHIDLKKKFFFSYLL